MRDRREEEKVAALVYSYLRVKNKIKPVIEIPEVADDPIAWESFRSFQNHLTRKALVKKRHHLFEHQQIRLNRIMNDKLMAIRIALPAHQTWFKVDMSLWVGWQNNDWPTNSGNIKISFEPPTHRIIFQTVT